MLSAMAMQPQQLSVLIGENIRRYREKKNLTQAALADALGATQGYISDLESGKRTPRVRRIAKIAEVLKIPPSYLMRPQRLAAI
jgi:transcriptional regulator with XRE-family HTH domain